MNITYANQSVNSSSHTIQVTTMPKPRYCKYMKTDIVWS